MSSTPNRLAWLGKGHAWLSRQVARAPIRFTLFAVLAAITAWPLLETASQLNMFRDSHVLESYETHAVLSLVRFHELPRWDPYYCGGIYSLGTPQSRFASPTFLLSLLFGAGRGAAVTAFAMLWIGMEGMYRYAKSRRAPGMGALLAAPIFALSGNFAEAPFFGWLNFLGFELLPWTLYGVRRAVRGEATGVVIAACSMAWIAGFGGTYAAPMGALLCGYELLEAAVRFGRKPSNLGRVAAAGAACAVLAVSVCAVRAWPLAETLRAAPRVIGGAPGLHWEELWGALSGVVDLRGGEWHNDQGAFLIGAMAIPAAMAGLFRLRSIPIVLVAALMFWAASGHGYGWSPYVGLRELPIYSVLRVPQRYLILFGICIAVLCATGIRSLEARARKRWYWGVPLVLLTLVTAWNVYPLIHNHHVAAGFRNLAAAPPELERDFHQARGNRWVAAYYAPMSRGSLSCWDAYPVPQSPELRADLPAEEYLADPSAGSVQRLQWSPNRIELKADLNRPARMRINQNWHPGWKSSVGNVVSDNGLLAVDMPQGQSTFTVRFLPRSALGGAVATLLALGAAGWLVWAERRKKLSLEDLAGWKKAAVALLIPVASLPLSWLVFREPPMPVQQPVAPNGAPVMVQELPAGASAVGAKFELPVVLEGFSAAPSRRGEPAAIELYWRVTGKVPVGTSIFVHFEGPGGQFSRADHDMVSAFTDLRHAPKNALMRDVVPVALPDRQGEWTVWVGLWSHLPEKGQRYKIVDPGASTVQSDRVKAGIAVRN